jgi:hypothetical protein
MSGVPGEKLREIVERYGQSLCGDPRRCEALLRDLCPEFKREIQVLVAALKEGIVTELMTRNASIPPSIVIARLSRRLYENVGIAEHFAAWSVETWYAALQAEALGEPEKIPIRCPSCGIKGRVSTKKVNRLLECPKCKYTFQVSRQAQEAVSGDCQAPAPDKSRFTFNAPDEPRAEQLRARAIDAVKTDDISNAINLIEEAIRLDACHSLDRYEQLRAAFYCRKGDTRPQRAIALYNGAVTRTRKGGDFVGAITSYVEAIRLDPYFSWPHNNLAWMLSTHPYPGLRNPEQAIVYGTRACDLSNWSSWPHLDTLSAAYARTGDFPSAIEVATAAFELTPSQERGGSRRRLDAFKRGEAYTDNPDPAAAGRSA